MKRFRQTPSPQIAIQEKSPPSDELAVPKTRTDTRESPIAPDDPLLEYFVNSQGFIELEKLQMDSPALEALRQDGIKITMPLISQGELIGLLNLGPRLSEQDYSTDDRRLLNTLVTQAAPALRVAQLARQQQAEARQLERMEQELRVARVIQETLLPKELPQMKNGKVTAFWRPARAVSGDFYDFLEFPDGRLGIVVADVTDKGVPAALVMATTRTILRATAERLVSPGEVLKRANDLLGPNIPRNMFVTCLYILLDQESGELVYANAGHNLPYKHTAEGVVELRATGMPLGLLPGMEYEEKQAVLEEGGSLMLYSDGLIEAHNPDGEMYGFPRLKQFIGNYHGDQDGAGLIDLVVDDLWQFTGAEWEQEDDVTIVLVERQADPVNGDAVATNLSSEWHAIIEFEVASEPGNERQVRDQVGEVVGRMGFTGTRLERLRTAVAEACMNAMEHGNQYQAELPVRIGVYSSAASLMVRITDLGGGREIPEAVQPDIDAKLAGLQSPRGWGLFLIESMVDEMHVKTDDKHHSVELIFHIEGDN